MRNLDILAAENGEHIRVLLCGEEQCYVVSCQHFRMPYPVASDLLAELQPVPAETYSVFVLDEDITNRQREGRNRKLDLIAPLLEDACIYDKSHRNKVVRQIAAEHGIARRTVLQYLWRYWVYQSKNALLPAERPTSEQHELTADEKAIRWALNKYYYTPQRQSLQTAYKMMLRAKYCDTHGTLKPEYPTFWQFRYFFRKNRDPISETISRQGLKAYQRNHRPFTGSVCDYAHRRCTMSTKGGKTPTTKMKEVKSMAKKIGIIVLLCFSLCVGGVSAFANEGHDETDTQTLIETQHPVSSVLFRQDGADIQQSTDEGKTWQSYSPIEETDYFTYDEFSAWIENETENIQKLVDAGEWTEAEATEALEYYDEILKSILEGKMVGKRASSSDDQLFFSMPDNAQPEQYQTFVFDGNTYKSIGPFDTEEELFNALKEYTDTEVEAGTMSQAEATALLEKYQ